MRKFAIEVFEIIIITLPAATLGYFLLIYIEVIK